MHHWAHRRGEFPCGSQAQGYCIHGQGGGRCGSGAPQGPGSGTGRGGHVPRAVQGMGCGVQAPGRREPSCRTAWAPTGLASGAAAAPEGRPGVHGDSGRPEVSRREHRCVPGHVLESGGVCLGPAPAPPRGGPCPQAPRPAARCVLGRPAVPQASAGRGPAPAHTPHTGCSRCPWQPATLREHRPHPQSPRGRGRREGKGRARPPAARSPAQPCHPGTRTRGCPPQAGDVHVQTLGLPGGEGPRQRGHHGSSGSLTQTWGSKQGGGHRHLDSHREVGSCTDPSPQGGGHRAQPAGLEGLTVF